MTTPHPFTRHGVVLKSKLVTVKKNLPSLMSNDYGFILFCLVLVDMILGVKYFKTIFLSPPPTRMILVGAFFEWSCMLERAA